MIMMSRTCAPVTVLRISVIERCNKYSQCRVTTNMSLIKHETITNKLNNTHEVN